jgi:hypothetical protein
VENVVVGRAEYNLSKSLRIDSEMVEELKFIALFEKTKSGTLMRMWIQDRILAYKQNPKYKRWRKELEATRS